MKRLLPAVLFFALLATLVPSTASAQKGEELDRFVLGLGIGLVDLSDAVLDSSTETYLQASFRILLGGDNQSRDDKTVVAYLEPEIGYWEASNRFALSTGNTIQSDQSDLLLGLNIIGVVPFNRVDYFLGAGIGIHSFDAGLNVSGVQIEDDETFGVNIQTGIDVHFTENFGVYGLLRIDLVEDIQEEQAKIVLGVRFSFG